MPPINASNDAYNAGKIQVLEGLDAVRMRPGMYIGTTSVRGLHHLLWEIVDNGIDEALAGYATEIAVTLHKDGSASVWDNGRGVPVDEHYTVEEQPAEAPDPGEEPPRPEEDGGQDGTFDIDALLRFDGGSGEARQ